MWRKFVPLFRIRIDRVIQRMCGDVTTHNSRTDKHRIFKLGDRFHYVIRHVCPLTKVKRSQVSVTRSRNVSAAGMI